MGTKAEMKMIEILLGHSPVLQVMAIQFDCEDGMFEHSKELSRFYHASPTVQILYMHTR